MEQIAGQIENIYTKIVNTRFGDKEVYHVVVNGNDVNVGFKCEYVEGETVTLEVEHKYGGYQLVQKFNTSTSTKSVGNTPARDSVAAPTKASAPAFPVNKNTKDISIIRQSSLNRAVESVGAMLADGIIKLDTEQAYLDKVLAIAYLYTDFGSGQREVKQAEAIEGYDKED